MNLNAMSKKKQKPQIAAQKLEEAEAARDKI